MTEPGADSLLAGAALTALARPVPCAERVAASGPGGGGVGLLVGAGWEVAGLVGAGAVWHLGVLGWPRGTAEVTALSDALFGLRAEALQGVRRQAAGLGASGVIDVRVELHLSSEHRHSPRFFATGTAVRRSGSPPQGAPFLAGVSPAELLLLTDAGWMPVALVMGSCVLHVARRRVTRWTRSPTRNVEQTSYTEALYRARERAMGRLQEAALAQHATGVVGVHVAERSHAWGPQVVELFVLGTAIVAIPPTGRHDRTPLPTALTLDVGAPLPDAEHRPRRRHGTRS